MLMTCDIILAPNPEIKERSKRNRRNKRSKRKIKKDKKQKTKSIFVNSNSYSMIVFIQKFKKLSSFVIWCLENHLPATNGVVAFLFSTKIPQRLTWKATVNFILFSLFVNSWVRGLFCFAWTVPELNRSARLIARKESKILWNYNWM